MTNSAASPEGLIRTNEGATVVLTRPWRSPGSVSFLVACVAMAVSSFYFIPTFARATAFPPPLQALAVAVPVLFDLGILYFTLMQFLNRTSIRAGNGLLQIKHEPLPWKGGVKIPAIEISQVFCKAERIRKKSGNFTAYQVWYVDRSGRQRRLLGGRFTREQVIFIEQEIERALGISNAPVPGEMTR